MKHEVITDRTEIRVTLPGDKPVIFYSDRPSYNLSASEYANQSTASVIEVRHVLEVRVESPWEVKH